MNSNHVSAIWQRPFPHLPVAIEPNGPDGYTLIDLTTGERKAYAVARPDQVVTKLLRSLSWRQVCRDAGLKSEQWQDVSEAVLGHAFLAATKGAKPR